MLHNEQASPLSFITRLNYIYYFTMVHAKLVFAPNRRSILCYYVVFITILATLSLIASENLSIVKGASATDANGRFSVGRRASFMGSALRDRLHKRQERVQERRQSRKEICYDMVGCFPMPLSKHSPLKKTPQSPETVDTKFWLFSRPNITTPQLLTYGDRRQSIVNSNFDNTKATVLIAHGFKGSVNDRAAVLAITSLLKQDDINVIFIDWEKGAAGPSYALAAANTQVIGRQLALLLMDVITLSTKPESIHIVGFSLGAHIAGFAGRAIQQRGIKIGRITGLDPASPLFRQLLGSSLPALSAEDALYVDVVHTDAARNFVNGFGLFKPIGYVDFFPNGGLNQPGCAHVRASLIVSHLEGTVNSSIVCNHARAWQLFLEILQTRDCKFLAFPCPLGHKSFMSGECFPSTCVINATDGSCAVMEYKKRSLRNRGPFYLVTRDSFPYCGDQLQATIQVSQKTPNSRGYFQLSIYHGSETTSFEFNSELVDRIQGGLTLRSLSAAQFGSISADTMPVLKGQLSFRSLEFQKPDAAILRKVLPYIYINSISVKDLKGNRWLYYQEDTVLEHKDDSIFDTLFVSLQLQRRHENL